MRMLALLSLLTLLTLLAGCGSLKTPICHACGLIERQGDEAIEILKTMSPLELSLKDADGFTPLYWSVYHDANKARNVILEKVDREKLLAEPVHAELIRVCAGAPRCSVNSLTALATIGFKIGPEALGASLVNTEKCSKEKFETLLTFRANRRHRDAAGNNLLHQIVGRAVRGRPKANQQCLLHGIKRLRRLTPALAKEKNKAAQTPHQYALVILRDPEKWGSSVTKAELTAIARALR